MGAIGGHLDSSLVAVEDCGRSGSGAHFQRWPLRTGKPVLAAGPLVSCPARVPAQMQDSGFHAQFHHAPCTVEESTGSTHEIDGMRGRSMKRVQALMMTAN